MGEYRPWRIAWLVISALLCVVMLCCYAWRGDAVAAVTIFPSWSWLLFGSLLLALSIHRRAPRTYRFALLSVGILWLIYLAAFVEEPRSMMRAAFERAPQKTEHSLRIVTLNCAGGSAAAAAEVKRFRPDIVLWQEIPSTKEVMRVANQVFGAHAEVVMGLDTAIATRGEVERKALPHKLQSHCVRAGVRLADGPEIEVVSLHLLPPPLRVDLWSPDSWKVQRHQQQSQREQMRAVIEQLDSVPQTIPIIVGGDFNLPQGDAVLRLLQPRLRDSFKDSGLGWGNTITNEYPFLRIDQIWLSRHFEALGVRAYQTKYSDHRMVVCDVTLQ